MVVERNLDSAIVSSFTSVFKFPKWKQNQTFKKNLHWKFSVCLNIKIEKNGCLQQGTTDVEIRRKCNMKNRAIDPTPLLLCLKHKT